MQIRIYIALAVILVIGCLLFVSRRSVVLSDVMVMESQSGRLEVRSADDLYTGHDFFLAPKDTIDDVADGQWFWQVFHGDSLFQEFYGQSKPPFTTQHSGQYIFTAYVDMREVARDTLFFKEGERVGMEWPSGELIVGNALVFKDLSTGVNMRKWLVIHRYDTLEQATQVLFTWVPNKAGDYRVLLHLQMSNGVDTLLENRYEVVAKPPERHTDIAENKKRSDPPKPDPKPKNEQPKDIPPERPVTPNKGDCFSTTVEPMARAAVVKVPMDVPKRDDMKWSDSGTVFDVVPSSDCQFASFEWWGGNNVSSGDATVTIECLELCDGRKSKKDDFQISADYYSPGKREFYFRTAPVLRANARYRVTIKPDSGARMGHFSLPQTSYKQDGFELIFTKPESGVFSLTFRVK